MHQRRAVLCAYTPSSVISITLDLQALYCRLRESLMLTATYSLVALTAEQDKVRSMLAKMRQQVQNAWHAFQGAEALETALDKLTQFEKFSRRRKIEVYLIPALRRVTREADALLKELDNLAQAGLALLRLVRTQLAEHAAQITQSTQSTYIVLARPHIGELWHSLNSYCDHALERLNREDQELFPLARRVFSIDDWFGIAAQFLADDSTHQGKQRPTARQARSSSSKLSMN